MSVGCFSLYIHPAAPPENTTFAHAAVAARTAPGRIFQAAGMDMQLTRISD
jgi:hypothetical protein